MEKPSRRICVAGGPGGISCTNRQDTPGISLHILPSEEDVARRKAWPKFVRRHRHNYQPTRWSALCSVHFSEDSFAVNREIAVSVGKKIKLKDDALEGERPEI